MWTRVLSIQPVGLGSLLRIRAGRNDVAGGDLHVEARCEHVEQVGRELRVRPARGGEEAAPELPRPRS